MPRHVAFLRGINLGRRRLKMAELREHMEDAGLDGVDTFLASGNVVFDHSGEGLPTLEEEVADHLEDALGYPVDTFIRPLARLKEIVALDAVKAGVDGGFNLHAIFLRDEAGVEVEEPLADLEGPDDRFHLLEREVLWLRRGGLMESEIGTRELEKALGGPGNTMRTLNTVRRIVAKFGE